MPNSTNEETLAASQRLLDYISGQQKSAPTVAPAAPAADSRPPVSEKKPGRFAHPLKSLSEPFAHRTTPTIGLVYDSDGILLTRTHHLTLGEPYLEKLRFVPYPAGTDATNLKESAACAVRALKSFAPDFARCRVWAMLAKAELSLLTLPPTKTEEERDAVALLKASQQTKYDAADLCFDYRLQENVVKGADVHAVGLMGSQKALSDLVAAFKEGGVTLAGVTSTKLSPAILLRPAFGPQPWNSFATLHVSDDCSILSIFSGGRMVQQRTINFGRALFLSKVTERLALQDMGRDVNTDSGRARLLHAANTLLANDHPTDEERQLLDEAMIRTYAKKGITHDNDTLRDPKHPERYREMPILGDLYAVLKESSSTLRLANILNRLVSGSAKTFNQQTNVSLDNKYIVLDISELTGDLLTVGMFMALDFVWDKAKENRTEEKAIFIDECWQLIGASSNRLAAEFVLEIFKIIRGYGGSAVCATQDLNDFFALEDGKYGKGIINNSKTKVILNLEDEEAQRVGSILHLSEAELMEITHFERGSALISTNNNNVAVEIKCSELEKELIATDRRELQELLKRNGKTS